MKCPICSNTKRIKKYRELYDDRYGFPGSFRLCECLECSHVFLDTVLDEPTITKLYTEYYQRQSIDTNDYRPESEAPAFKLWFHGEYSHAFRWVPKNVRVLDIGCGFGASLGYHKNRGCEVFGVEADRNIIRIASKYGFNVHVGLFEAGRYEPDFFDYVTMDQVIEHVSDPVQTLRDVFKVLKPGGVAVVSTPNAGGWGPKIFRRFWINWHVPYHLHIFSPGSMKRAAEKSGLIIEKARSFTDSHWLYFQMIHMLTRPAQGTASCFWTPHLIKNRTDRAAIAFADLLRISRILHLVTRVMDGAQMGDNFIYFLRKK